MSRDPSAGSPPPSPVRRDSGKSAAGAAAQLRIAGDARDRAGAADDGRWIDAVYRVQAGRGDIEARAQAIALEQSIEAPLAAVGDERVLREVVAQVGDIVPAGAQAFDGCGNSIPVHAFNTGTDSSGPGPTPGVEGTYSVSYVAWDAEGRTVSAIRTVTVNDSTAPTLALRGAARVTHTCGSQWVDPGVDSVDACYGNVAPQVQRSGEVNGWVAGSYTVTYSLTDSGGNSAASVSRTVEVVNCPW